MKSLLTGGSEMETRNISFKSLFCLVAIFCFFIGIHTSGCSREAPEEQAKEISTQTNVKDMANDILEQAGIKGGLIVHLNCGDGVLTEALQKNDSYMVQGLDRNMDNVSKARQYIASKDKYGPISVDCLKGDRLPYINNMVNLIVADDLGSISMDEAMRVLTPDGVLITKNAGNWKKTVKPVPPELDEWNQYLYDASNNVVSKDKTIHSIKHYQWIGSPRWARHHDTTASMSALVSANGRIFYILDEGPKESIQLPAENYLVARDAYNGTVLWKRPIKEWQNHLFALKSGPAYLPRRLVAIGDRVFVTLGINAPLSELDAATGEILRTFPNTEQTSEVIFSDNTLFLLVGRPEKSEATYAPKETYVWDNADWARAEWAWDKEPAQIMAIDLSNGNALWTKQSPIAPLSLSADSKAVYFYDGSKLIGLDRNSGKEKWQSDTIKTRKIDTAYAPRLVVSEDVLVFSMGSQEVFGPGSMIALSATDGKELWDAPQPSSGHYSPEDIFVIDGLVWTGNTAWGQADGKYIGRDLHTGELVKEFPCDADIYWFHQRCYPSKATENYIISSRTGIEFIDLEQEHWNINHYTRGGCFYGIMPSNGLVYTPPHACACYMEAKLNGFCALGGSYESEPDLEAASSQNRLEKGPAYEAQITDDAGSADWPTYRHDAKRSAYTPFSVSPDVEFQWSIDLGGRLSSPVVAGNRVYVAQVDKHTLYSLDARTGDKVWKFIAGGRVDSPPTIFKGRVLFGSVDGYVYCLNAADGTLIWRFRAAPLDRRMVAFEQVESVWPVHGTVLVQDNRIYCVAGRTVFLDGGMRLIELDPETGQKLAETILDEIDPGTGKNLHAYVEGLNMPVGLPDILSSDGQYVYMRSQQFDLDGNRTQINVRDIRDQSGEGAHVFSPIGFLDDSQFSRSYMMYGKSVKSGWGGWEVMGKLTPSGRLIAVDDDAVYGYARKPEFLCESIVLEYQLYAADKAGNPKSIEVISDAAEAPVKGLGSEMIDYAPDWKARQGLPDSRQSAVQFRWLVDKPPLQVRAMVLSDKTLFIAGPPDVVDEEEAFFALDDAAVLEKLAEQSALLKGKEGGFIWAVSAKDGEKIAEYKLDCLPVWDGMVAANGNLFLATMDGEVICYSEKGN
jgi:outer membrane protein assembly factor BamB